jgi:hypothetical protein
MHTGQTKMLNCKAFAGDESDGSQYQKQHLLLGYRSWRTMTRNNAPREQRSVPICVIPRHA